MRVPIVIYREDHGFHVWHVPDASDRPQGGGSRCAGLGIGQPQQRTAAAETVHVAIAVRLRGSRMEETVVMSGIKHDDPQARAYTLDHIIYYKSCTNFSYPSLAEPSARAIGQSVDELWTTSRVAEEPFGTYILWHNIIMFTTRWRVE